jgi:hypothetical protein
MPDFGQIGGIARTVGRSMSSGITAADPDAELRAYVARLMAGEGLGSQQDYITSEVGTLPRQFSELAQAQAAQIARAGVAGSGFMQQAASKNRADLSLAKGEATLRGQRQYQNDRQSQEERAMGMRSELADRDMRRAAIAEESRRNAQAEWDANSFENLTTGKPRPE